MSRSDFRLRAQGLDPGCRYRRTGDGVESTGSALMTAGFPVDFPPLARGSPARRLELTAARTPG